MTSTEQPPSSDDDDNQAAGQEEPSSSSAIGVSSVVLINDGTDRPSREQYAQFLKHFTSQDLAKFQDELGELICARKIKRTARKMQCSCVGGKSRQQHGAAEIALLDTLITERNTLLSIAKMPLNFDNPQHMALLDAIFSSLTGKPRPAETKGPHWESIGFLGPDPSQELRGSGMMGLLHLFAVISHDFDLMQQMFQMSQKTEKSFPFCVAILHMSRKSLDMIKNGTIDTFILDLCSVEKALTRILLSFCHEFYSRWSTRMIEFNEFQMFFDVELAPFAFKRWRLMLRRYEQFQVRRIRENA